MIGDTGSTDGTRAFIKSLFAARKKPGKLHSFPPLKGESTDGF
jgi:hypothetical protein